MRLILSIFLFLICPWPVYAYIGPGLGLGVIGTILGVLLSIFLAIFAIFWYPIKRLFKKIKNRKKKVKDEPN